MKKLKRDLIKPEKVVVKKTTVVVPKEEYPEEAKDSKEYEVVQRNELTKIPEKYEFTWNNRGRWNPYRSKMSKLLNIPMPEFPEGDDFEWADEWFEGSAEHEVVKGDDLTKISKKYNVPLDSIIKWNGIKNPDKIKIGEVIKLSK